MAPRSYATPKAFKTALEARIRAAAEDAHSNTHTEIVHLRQLRIFERFLARMGQTFGDRMIVKGGLALEMRLRRARMTADVDVRISGGTETLLHELRRAGQLDLGDSLSFEVEPDAHHPTIEGKGVPYAGQRFRAQAMLEGKVYGRRFGVDVGVGDRMSKPPDVIETGDFFAFAGLPRVSVRVYAREVHVAEKLHALTLPRARENSRVRDLPDLALLALTGSFSSDDLRTAIEATFTHRATHPPPTRLPEPPPSWEAQYVHIASENGLRWQTLGAVLAAARAFLDPVLVGVRGSWDPGRGTWVDEG